MAFSLLSSQERVIARHIAPKLGDDYSWLLGPTPSATKVDRFQNRLKKHPAEKKAEDKIRAQRLKDCLKTIKMANKMHRVLDALLGHLLDKIIPVRYKLSSTKLPEYLSHKYRQAVKTGNAPNVPQMNMNT